MSKDKGELKLIPQVEYKPITRPRETSSSPTLSSLMTHTGEHVQVTIPTRTLAFGASYQPICLNSEKFEPGKTYSVHPLIAAELRDRIAAFERSVISSVSGINMAGVEALELTPEGSYPESHVIDTIRP